MHVQHQLSKASFFALFLTFVAFQLSGQGGPGDFSQNPTSGGQLSGNLELNANFFFRDSLIGAANIPQYDRQLYGADSWLNLAYSNWGFNFGLRFDFFHNSNLLNPTDSYSNQGIGRWFVERQIDELGISAGYLYDQIGSGIIFRAYEERPLAIDNALVGLRLTYDFLEDWQIKAFTGRQKQQFDLYRPIIKGLSVEGYHSFRTNKGKNLSIAPGLGVVNRTLDDNTMDNLVAVINTYTVEDAFEPKYNTYAFSLYNTLTSGKFTWYVEGAFKTEEAINDPFGEILTPDSSIIVGDKLVNKPGSVIYTSLGYATKGLGLTLEGKRTENFSLRVSPQTVLNRGLISFQPILSRINTYRLTARYTAVTQELGEYAFQADLSVAPSRKLNFQLNYTNIQDLDGGMLYSELHLNSTFKYERDWTLLAGVQLQAYNQSVYEFKPDVPIVETIIPYFDFLYKIDRRKAIRFEAQYMNVGQDDKADAKQDYGDWLFALAEFSIAPKWTFAASDMFNISPGKNSPSDANGEKKQIHFPRFDVYYTHKANRFSLSYIKQVEGIVCAGGICRLEPAFSGMRLSVNTSF